MKMRSYALTLVVAVGFVSAACDSDESAPLPDGGGPVVIDSGVVDSGGGGTCVGGNSAYTRATLEEASTSDKACTGASASTDLDVICSVDLEVVAGMCSLTCVGSIGDPAAFSACVVTCMNGKPQKPSMECLNCYGASAACSIPCAGQCIPDPSAPDCVTCRVNMGCYGTFFECSGLPTPRSDGRLKSTRHACELDR